MLAFKFRKLTDVLRQGRSTKGRPGIAGTGDAFVFDDASQLHRDSHMLQSNLANAGELQADYISIGGRTLAFDQIFNEAFFTPSNIKELRKTYNHNAPYPHLVFEGLFSPTRNLIRCKSYCVVEPMSLSA